MQALGVPLPLAQGLTDVARVLPRHALVALGPAATRPWHTEGSQHTQAACFVCKGFGLHGTCEHTHAAFLHEGLLDIHAPRLAQRNGRLLL